MTTRTALHFALLETLDLLEDFLFLASKPSMVRMDRYWGYTEMRASYRAFQRWEMLRYVEKVREGDKVFYRLAERGAEILSQRRPSPSLRKRPWDGRWRMVVFDFPETARKARDAFRSLLRLHRMGCLQKSVWITPYSVIPEWKRLLKESELTNWVLLFESAELGPVEDTDIARTVWGLDELNKRYDQYLREHRGLPGRLAGSRASTLEGELGRAVRRESQMYFDLLSEDPMLPSVLLSESFLGPKADLLHKEVRSGLRTLLAGDRP